MLSQRSVITVLGAVFLLALISQVDARVSIHAKQLHTTKFVSQTEAAVASEEEGAKLLETASKNKIFRQHSHAGRQGHRVKSNVVTRNRRDIHADLGQRMLSNEASQFVEVGSKVQAKSKTATRVANKSKAQLKAKVAARAAQKQKAKAAFLEIQAQSQIKTSVIRTRRAVRKGRVAAHNRRVEHKLGLVVLSEQQTAKRAVQSEAAAVKVATVSTKTAKTAANKVVKKAAQKVTQKASKVAAEAE